LVEKASALGLGVLALTDHDTVAGIDEAWSVAERRKITFIPGVELSTDYPEGECHILGYFLDHRSPVLQEALRKSQESRLLRGLQMVERLIDLGLPLPWERVQELARGGIVTRAHVAEALLEAGLVPTRQEAFDRYIGHGGPAYVPRHKFSPEDAIRLIIQAHGVPVLAHPTYVEPGRDWIGDLSHLIPWPFLERLQAAGLLGLEAGYCDYPQELVARLIELARHYGLVATGGSDFHGYADHGDALGCAPVPPEAVTDLFHLAQRCGSPWVQSFPGDGPP
jgi:predicted metal-dependent phosphoesterase TrpH